MSGLYLGIDTSNYKTSVAVTDSLNHVVFERSEFLEVEKGKRGLRQSEAFFRHSQRLPEYIEELCKSLDIRSVEAIGVSSRPRRVEGSYMPCFLAGINTAREIAAVLDIPLHEFSHQEGHAAAVIEDSDTCSRDLSGSDSLMFHLSGGTTEFLLCRMDDAGYDLRIVGGTRDISIGQLIDRVGVAMGYPFPSGAYLDEEVSRSSDIRTHILPAIKIKDGYFNLSGAETKLLRAIGTAEKKDYPAYSAELFDSVAALLAAASYRLSNEYHTDTVYMAGGVASSAYIRSVIQDKLQSIGKDSPAVIFGKPSLSGDNAVGIARLARRIQNSR